MVRVSILYPNTKDGRFDMRYYADTHMPLSIARLGARPGFRGVSVESGFAGVAPGKEAAFVAMCHFLFDSADSFLAAFAPHATELQGDMANYTDIAPIIQVSEVIISK